VPDGERRVAGACVRSQDGELVVEVSGPAEPGAAARQVERILSLDVDGSGFPEVGERDPAIGRLQARYPGLRPVSFPSPFEAGAWFVLSQRMQAGQAVALKARITEELGERVAICGDERAAFPAPGVVAELEGLAGLPERKLATLRALAQAAAQGELDGERLRAMGGEAAVEELQRLPGVGPFTAQGIVVRGAGEPDHLATAEPRMAQAAALAYGVDEPLAPEELARRGEAWRPYRAWVGLLLRLGLQDASHETRPHFEMHWRAGERARSRGR
jgi:DNA-3-methyladenine glycosylase II